MTSMIFGSIYMAHQGIVAHRRGKQRQKNYERWEDLRDEYDEQKKITRESRSLDIQRTGSWDQQQGYFNDGEYTAREERPILTLRDQQEANDARLSWRPQESWEPSHRSSNNPFQIVPQRTASVPAVPPHLQSPPPQQQTPPPQHPQLQHAATTPSQYWQSRGELKPQKTGATWDDGLPAPLAVTRRTYEDYQYPHARRGSLPPQQDYMSPRTSSQNNSQAQSRRGSAVPSRTATPVYVQPQVVLNDMADLHTKLSSVHIEPVQSHVPGGRMAELIERGY